MWYEFDQNNSGGSFVCNDKLCHRLYIEAKSNYEACSIAEKMGVYFNGVQDGTDCSCCGDRWSTPQGIEFPRRYGAFNITEAKKIALKYKSKIDKSKWSYEDRSYDILFKDIKNYAQYLADKFGNWTNPDGRIFYADGKVLEVKSQEAI